nr:hypothetical protein Iba_chr03bCG2920 [Ipomoea batatas]
MRISKLVEKDESLEKRIRKWKEEVEEEASPHPHPHFSVFFNCELFSVFIIFPSPQNETRMDLDMCDAITAEYIEFVLMLYLYSICGREEDEDEDDEGLRVEEER